MFPSKKLFHSDFLVNEIFDNDWLLENGEFFKGKKQNLLVQFAQLISLLSPSEGFNAKLRQIKNWTLIDLKNQFVAFMCELKVAEKLLQLGCKVEFVEETQKRKSPDLKIIAGTKTFFAEIKTRNSSEGVGEIYFLKKLSEAQAQLNSLPEASQNNCLVFICLPYLNFKTRQHFKNICTQILHQERFNKIEVLILVFLSLGSEKSKVYFQVISNPESAYLNTDLSEFFSNNF